MPADSEIYAVYDQSKTCNVEAKGCALLGQAYQYEGQTIYGDVFLKNDPDKYKTALCGADAVGCEAFAYDKGEQYFKDPGDQVCEWRQEAGKGESWGWFKKRVKRCDASNDGAIGSGENKLCIRDANCNSTLAKTVNNKCKSDSDCNDKNKCVKAEGEIEGVCHKPCLVDNADYTCPITDNKTLGIGGVTPVSQPGESYDNYLPSLKPDIYTLGNIASKSSEIIEVMYYNELGKWVAHIAGTPINVNQSITEDNANNVVVRITADTDITLKTLSADGSYNDQPIHLSPIKWAGICSAANSGCGEYIDPMSKFNTNLIFNGSFQSLAGSPTDGWISEISVINNTTYQYRQNIILEPNTVYRLGRTAGAGALRIYNCTAKNVASKNVLQKIFYDNTLSSVNSAIELLKQSEANSQIFYYKGDGVATCDILVSDSSGAVELKPAVIDYQLVQNLDATSCNGIVDFNKGCVLFNERSQDGANLTSLKWDAQPDSGGSPASGDKANTILKVTPDRVCDKWLAPRSYAKDEKGNNVIYDIGLCDALDDKGDCSSFISSSKENQIAGKPKVNLTNLSG